MPHKSKDLLLIIAITSLAMMANLTDTMIRALFTLPLVLVLPGYAISCALFGKDTISVAERLLLSLALSLCCTILSGLLLHWTPWGLQPASRAILLGGITLLASLIARKQPDRQLMKPPKMINFDRRDAIVLGLAGLILIAAIAVARTAAMQQEETFTQLWMIPNQEVSGYSIMVGMRNMERHAVQYALEVDISESVRYRYPLIELRANEEWITTAALPAEILSQPIAEARLYRLDAPQSAYRQVELRYLPDKQ